MRLSTERSDAGHATYQALGEHRYAVKVTLDGEPLRDCITADDEAGEVLVMRRGLDGRPLHERGEICKEWRRGRVEIIVPERGQA